MSFRRRSGILDRFRDMPSVPSYAPNTGGDYNSYYSRDSHRQYRDVDEQVQSCLKTLENFASDPILDHISGHSGNPDFQPYIAGPQFPQSPTCFNSPVSSIPRHSNGYELVDEFSRVSTNDFEYGTLPSNHVSDELPESALERFRNRSSYEYNHGSSGNKGTELKVTVNFGGDKSDSDDNSYPCDRDYNPQFIPHNFDNIDLSHYNSNFGCSLSSAPDPYETRQVLYNDEERETNRYRADNDFDTLHQFESSGFEQGSKKFRGRGLGNYKNRMVTNHRQSEDYPVESMTEERPYVKNVKLSKSTRNYVSNGGGRNNYSRKSQRGSFSSERPLKRRDSFNDSLSPPFTTKKARVARNVNGKRSRPFGKITRGVLSRVDFMSPRSSRLSKDERMLISPNKMPSSKPKSDSVPDIIRSSLVLLPEQEFPEKPSDANTSQNQQVRPTVSTVEYHTEVHPECVKQAPLTSQEEPKLINSKGVSECKTFEAGVPAANLEDASCHVAVKDTAENGNKNDEEKRNKLMENHMKLMEKFKVLSAELKKLKDKETELNKSSMLDSVEIQGHLNQIRKLKLEISVQIKKVKNVLMLIRKLLGSSCDSSGPLSICSDDQIHSQTNRELDFYDPQQHFCLTCGEFFVDLDIYLEHLHSKEHMEKYKARYEGKPPWRKGHGKSSPKNFIDLKFPSRGSELLHGVKCFFCEVCAEWLGDAEQVYIHLTCKSHNDKYLKMSGSATYQKELKERREKCVWEYMKKRAATKEMSCSTAGELQDKTTYEPTSAVDVIFTIDKKGSRKEDANGIGEKNLSATEGIQTSSCHNKLLQISNHQQAKSQNNNLQVLPTLDCNRKNECPTLKELSEKASNYVSGLEGVPFKDKDTLKTEIDIKNKAATKEMSCSTAGELQSKTICEPASAVDMIFTIDKKDSSIEGKNDIEEKNLSATGGIQTSSCQNNLQVLPTQDCNRKIECPTLKELSEKASNYVSGLEHVPFKDTLKTGTNVHKSEEMPNETAGVTQKTILIVSRDDTVEASTEQLTLKD